MGTVADLGRLPRFAWPTVPLILHTSRIVAAPALATAAVGSIEQFSEPA